MAGLTPPYICTMWTIKLTILLVAIIPLTEGNPIITTTTFTKNTILVNWIRKSSGEYSVSFTRDGVPNPGEQNISVSRNTTYTIADALRSKNITVTVFEMLKPQLNDTVTFNTPSLVRTTVGSSLTLIWPLTASKLNFGYNVKNMDTKAVYLDIAPPNITGVEHPSFKFNGDPGNLTQTTNITISNISIDEAGYIVSTAGTVESEPFGGVVLAVEGKPWQPNITGITVVEEGNNTILNCSSRPKTSPDYVDFPALTYQWIVNRSDALPNNFVHNGSQLTITSVKKTDAYQRISCRAFQNRTASAFSEEVNLNVQYGPTEVIIRPQNTSYIMYEGGEFGPISCTADCNPPCTIRWRFNATHGDGKFVNISANSNLNNVTIDGVGRNNTGVYRCLAVTSIRSSNKPERKDVHLDVRYGPDLPFIQVDNLNITPNASVKKRENSMVQLHCSTESNPVSTMAWTRVKSQQELKESVSGNKISHTLTYVQCEDSGLYRCSADNTIGLIKMTEFHLQIKCAPRAGESFSRIYGVKVNSSVKIVIPVRAFPEPKFYWINTTDQVQMGSPRVTSQNGSIYQFEIESMLRVTRPAHFRNYTFRVNNSVGANDYTITVVAKDRPVAPRNVSSRDVRSNSVNLTWISEFNGGSEQTFLIEQINSNGNIPLANVSDPGQGKKISYVVNGLLPKRRYKFQIISTNSLGDTRNISEPIEVETKELKATPQGSAIGVTVGLSATFVVIIIAVVILAVIILLKKKKMKRASDTHDVMYAAVNKPEKKKPGKAGSSREQPDDEMNLYANTEDNAHRQHASSNGANQRGDPVRTQNQDGLIYIDVEFQKQSKGALGKPVIHGDESRTEYMQVDFTRRGSPEAAEGENTDE